MDCDAVVGISMIFVIFHRNRVHIRGRRSPTRENNDIAEILWRTYDEEFEQISVEKVIFRDYMSMRDIW